MGFSIGRVFRPIEKEMKKYAEVDSLYMPSVGYGLKSLIKNINAVKTKCKKNKYDVVHITGTEHYLLPFLRHQNTVVTVHDMGTDQLNKSIKGYWRLLGWVKTIPFAKKITFISHFTEKEALSYLQFKPKQTSVIGNPLDGAFMVSPKKINKEKPVILHIGTSKRKNLDGTIRALEGLCCHLRIIGNIDNNEMRLLRSLKIDYSNVSGISDQQVIEEYKNCDIVCFPTFYEGFGMPILEAQKTGRVVVTSNLPPMNEICGKGAVLVDPNNIVSIRNGIKTAMDFYDRFVQLGNENASSYSAEMIANLHYKNYLELLSKNEKNNI